MVEAPNFEARFRRLVVRLRWRAVLRLASRLLPWFQAPLFAWLVLAKLAAWNPEPVLSWLAGTLTLLLAAGVVLALWRTESGMRAALLADRRLGGREVVAAAYELGPHPTHPLGAGVRSRAGALLTGDGVRRVFPLSHLKAWRPSILALCAFVLIPFLPPVLAPSTVEAAEPDPELRAAGEILSQELDNLPSQLREVQRPETREVLEGLDELAAELEGGEVGSVQEALLKLEEVESGFQGTEEHEGEAGAAEMAGLGELVDELGQEPLAKDLVTAMGEGDRQALRRALSELAEAGSGGPLSGDQGWQEQLQRFAGRLEALATALELAGETELAEPLRQLAQAMETGDMQRARQLMESLEVAEAFEAAGEMALDERAAQEVGELLQLARYLLGQGTPPRLEGQAAQGQRECPDGSPCSGPGPGAASTNLEGPGYESGAPVLRDRQTLETGSQRSSYEALYDSQLTPPDEWEDVRTPGQPGSEGALLSEVGRGPGVPGEASLPLLGSDAAVPGPPESALDLESVPLGYRELVRRYFERNPSNSEAAKEGPP